MKPFNYEATQLKESVFSVVTELANKNAAINLAQGFPDFDGPDWLLKTAQQKLLIGKNQYAPSYGAIELRQAIANNYSLQYQLDYDPVGEILITNGATEAIFSTIKALINPGDEVMAFEPLYDSYAASVRLAKGKIKPIALKLPDFSFNFEDLISQISSKTKLLILNNPHNPTGKVFSKKELGLIVELAIKYDFYILSDEVYEHLTFDVDHLPTAAIAGAKDRVITISSIGKTFSLTGWKVGWIAASKDLVKVIHSVHQFICFCVAHPLQLAAAEAIQNLPKYLPLFRTEYAERKDLIVKGLEDLEVKVIRPQGTYFAVSLVPEGFSDWKYVDYLIQNAKVATIPLSPFYIQSTDGERLIRICFAKNIETLKKALENLKKIGGKNV